MLPPTEMEYNGYILSINVLPVFKQLNIWGRYLAPEVKASRNGARQKAESVHPTHLDRMLIELLAESSYQAPDKSVLPFDDKAINKIFGGDIRGLIEFTYRVIGMNFPAKKKVQEQPPETANSVEP